MSSIEANSFTQVRRVYKMTFEITILCLTICNEFVSGTLYLTFLFDTNLQLQIHIKDNFFAP